LWYCAVSQASSPEHPIALRTASTTFALKADVWFRGAVGVARLLLICRLKRARGQAKTPPIALCRFPRPVLTDRHLGRWHLTGAAGDVANVILTAVGNNLRLDLRPVEASFAPATDRLSAAD
jgi:hypothetical protein